MTIPLRTPGKQFGDDFLIGTATASYQIEGAVDEDGRAPSIWDTFSHTPGKTANGDTGDVACDHYHRLDEDLDLIANLGVDAYRFSIAWSRVIPTGAGEVNRKGIDFYSRLVDGLLERGVKPVVTLYHWDLPQTLQDAGGWPNRATADAFAAYAEVMGRALGDRVVQWTTLNEPWCIAYLGHCYGVHAPGHKDGLETLQSIHTLNLAHGKAVQALRSVVSKQDAQYSVTCNLETIRPINPSDPDDVDAADRARTMYNRVWTRPMLAGFYPDRMFDITQHVTDWSFIQDGDLETINQPIDVLGLNWYNPHYYGRARDGQPGLLAPGLEDIYQRDPLPGEETTEMGWIVDETGLSDMLLALEADFPHMPVIITENGRAVADRMEDGQVHDAERVDYLVRHLSAVHDANERGANCVGYFVWSLMDNYEWADGYAKRFGIHHMDYETLVRTPKDSARWYTQFAKTRTIPEADTSTWS